MLGVSPAAETIRAACERQAGRIARWQGQESASAEAFREAEGGWEFAVDAGKVNTIEAGWRNLKIVVVQKRPAAEPATPAQWQSRELPEATARVMWADISAARRFRRSWWARLKRLGLPSMARLHAPGDGASWIWKAAGRALSGCGQTLDIYHASQHIASAGKRLYGEGTAQAKASHEPGRELLLKEGWVGVCRLIGEELEREDTPARRGILGEAAQLLRAAPGADRLCGTVGRRSGDRKRSGGGCGQDLGPEAEGPRSPLETQERPGDGGADLLPPDRPMGPVLEPSGVKPKIPWSYPTGPVGGRIPRISLSSRGPVRYDGEGPYGSVRAMTRLREVKDDDL